MLLEEGEVVDTKVDDGRGCRNEQCLKFSHNLWFFLTEGCMYITILHIGNTVGCKKLDCVLENI